MNNLRITNVEVSSSTKLVIEFSEEIFKNITVDNFSVNSKINSVPDAQVISVLVKSNLVYLTIQPLTPFVKYDVVAKNTTSYKIISLENKYQLSEDGVSNVFEILGPIEDENIFKQVIYSILKDSVYDLETKNRFESNVLDSISTLLDKSLEDIKQTKNENYLFYDVTDEQKLRGSGPFDKLNEGSAFEITRVSKTPSNKISNINLSIDTSVQTLISLQQESLTEILPLTSFDKKELILDLKKSPVIKLTSLKFTLSTSNPNYTYNIQKFGYQLKENKYDKYSFKYSLLENNQVKLSSELFLDTDFDISKIVRIEVGYLYKELSRLPSDTLDIYSINKSNYELIEPLLSVINLKYGSITNQFGESVSLNGLAFRNQESLDNTHQSFLYEMEFNLDSLPFNPGQYSVDYNSGTIYVFGKDYSNSGSGEFPPLVSYNYKFTYQSNIDYTYDSSSYDLAILSTGKLINTNFILSFNYESALVKDLDYKANLHQEALNERVDNRLIALNVLSTSNYPITNVFDIYNESTGEKYTLSRFSDNKVYFKYITPPNVKTTSNELLQFSSISEELIVNDIVTNTNNIKIATCTLSNKNIISKTLNSIASYVNTTFVPADGRLSQELCYLDNYNNINESGQYVIDYVSGVVYVGIDVETKTLGYTTYFYLKAITQNKHIISVDDLYNYNFNLKTKSKLEYDVFDDNTINILLNKTSNEKGLSESYPYYLNNDYVGTFSATTFESGTKDFIVDLFGVYESNDFYNSTNPLNFSTFCEYSDNTLKINPFVKTYNLPVNTDGYYVSLDKDVFYNSSNITYSFYVTDLLGSEISVLSFEEVTNKLYLDTINPQSVNVQATFTINNLSNIVVDYSSGSISADYTYLADEILVSYEYGENSIDFRESSSIKEKDVYYVSYKVGALRDALIKNFGTLINIPELFTFDSYFNRERYRDAIYAALSSFIKGSTNESINNIVYNITHLPAKITESNLNGWELGYNVLNPSKVKTSGDFTFIDSKRSSGILVDSDKTVSLSTFSNMNLEEGTLEFWTTPNWNGLDNFSDVKFKINYNSGLKYPIQDIYIGSNMATLDPDKYITDFTLNKKDVVYGSPSLSQDGVYIYYSEVNGFDKWNLSIIDGYSNVDYSTVSIEISSEDNIFNLVNHGINNPTITSFKNKISVSYSDNLINSTLSFNSDKVKYLIDSGEELKNRFSIYNNAEGYLVFRVLDSNGKKYSIQSNISSWKANENHHIAVSWKLNSKNKKDEMHLFVDGFEVSNNLRYSSGFNPYNNQKYSSEEKSFILSSLNIVGSNDLSTTAGSSIVTSSVDFSAYNIVAGDTLYVLNNLFDPSGYLITNVNGQELTLDTAMSYSMSDIDFSVNMYEAATNPSFRLYKNTVVNVYDYFLNSSDGYTNTNESYLYSSSDFSNVSINDLVVIDKAGYEDYYVVKSIGLNYLELDSTFSADSSLSFYVYSTDSKELRSPRNTFSDYEFLYSSGDYIKFKNGLLNKSIVIIQTLGLNFESINKKYYLWSDNSQNIIKTQLPTPTDIDSVKIKKIILDNTAINGENSTVIGFDFTSNNLDTYNTIDSTTGRYLDVTINGSNIDFSSNVIVNIDGYVDYVNVTEQLSFNDYQTNKTVNKFQSVLNINVSGKIANVNKNYLSINCKEYSVITTSEDSSYYPEIKYSYEVNSGNTLYSDGYYVVDLNNIFSYGNIGDHLLINSPIDSAGFYKIINLIDLHTLEIEKVSGYDLPLSFTSGEYKILKSTSSRAGFQNGYFHFEVAELPGEKYFLKKGLYEFVYNTYLNINTNLGKNLFIGSDINSLNQSNCGFGDLAIYNVQLSDVRYGELSSANNSITNDFNSIIGVEKNKNILFLSRLDSLPIKNESDFYLSDKKYIYSNYSVNDNFSNSVYLDNYSINETNNGYLNESVGTIDMWISPLYDSYNDNNYRFYFDSSSVKELELTSSLNNVINLPEEASEIISIKTNVSKIDYAIGSKILLSKTNSTEEIVTSTDDFKIVLKNKAYQVLSIRINNSYSTVDYSTDSSLSKDGKTIYLSNKLPSAATEVKVLYKKSPEETVKNKQFILLNKKLPYNNTKVKVKFIPKGMNGDKICLYKDKDSYLNFGIRASDKDYVVRHPIYWESNSWHKVRVSWETNTKASNMLMFVDGYKASSVTIGSDLILQENNFNPTILGDGYSEPDFGLIKLLDSFNQFSIGSDCFNENIACCSVDNFKISNIYKPVYKFRSESIDPSYSANNSYPSTKDLYTTYLLDFNNEYEKVDDDKFVKIVNKSSGLYEFVVDVYDNFKILENNTRSKEILEILVKRLKPANSRVFIKYN